MVLVKKIRVETKVGKLEKKIWMNEWDERILEWTENWMKDKWERKMWTDVLERRTGKTWRTTEEEKNQTLKKKKIKGEKSKF